MEPLTANDLQTLLALALRVARLGGDAALRRFRTRVQVDRKDDGSPVTAADREAERLMREALLAAYPTHGIVGEEFGETGGDTAFRWILDPIDGTISFVHGSPLFGVLVALEHQGTMVIGVIHMPALDETVSAARGHGCFWNGQPCKVSMTRRIGESLLVVTDDRAMRRARPGYARLCESVALVRSWGDCYGALMVATGRADIFLDNGLAITDVAALQPIVEEAGGRITDWRAVRTISDEVLVTNGQIHDEVLHILEPY